MAGILKVKDGNTWVDIPAIVGPQGVPGVQGPQGLPGPKGDPGDVQSVAGKTGAVTLDAGDVEFDDTDTYAAGSVGAGLADLKSQMGAKASTDMALGAYPIESASGAVASFTDGADSIPVKDLTIGIEPVQAAGTPTPEAPLPISGWTGANVTRTSKNLLHNTNSTVTINGVTFTVNPDDTITTTGTASGTAVFRIYQTFSINHDLILNGCPPGGNYDSKYSILPCNATGSLVAAADIGQSSGVRIPASDAQQLGQIQIVIRNGVNANGLVFRPMISIAGDADLTYAPYSGEPQSYPITFPAEAGTVYGGTLDVTTGVLSVRPYYASYAGETLVGPWVSSMDVYAPGVTPTIGAQVVDMGGTVTTYQLPSVDVLTLLGANAIYADTGDVLSLTYRVDPMLYADKRVNATRSIIAGIEPTMTASKAYTTGDLLIVGDTLYKVAASIASGATLTPGTNVNPTTVAEQLLLLANA